MGSNPTSCVGIFSPDQSLDCCGRSWKSGTFQLNFIHLIKSYQLCGIFQPWPVPTKSLDCCGRSWKSGTFQLNFIHLIKLMDVSEAVACITSPPTPPQVLQFLSLVNTGMINHSGLHCPSLPNKHKYLGICSCAMLLLCLCTQMFLLRLRQSPFRGINGGT